jgi:hypothetical protein
VEQLRELNGSDILRRRIRLQPGRAEITILCSTAIYTRSEIADPGENTRSNRRGAAGIALTMRRGLYWASPLV